MMNYIYQFIEDFIAILNEMAPYLLLGFLFAGILKVVFPQNFIDKYFGKTNLKSVIYSTLLGIPLPLCSCGVIPTSISFYKSGMSKGATVSFLISTPQTGLDSILVTYSLLGLPFAFLRPLVALFTGVLGGAISNIWEKPIPISIEKVENKAQVGCSCHSCGCDEEKQQQTTKKHSKIYEMFKYAFVDFLQDISKWLIIGLLLAAFISVLVPDDFFEQFIGNQFLEMVMILVVSIPLYVCATASVPIAAILMTKGLSAGAALVFLMAGPATNAATITVLRKTLGKQTMWIYLISIIVGALFFGTIINQFLPASWFNILQFGGHHQHHEMLPSWLEWGSSILLIVLIINGFVQKKRKNKTDNTTETSQMETKTILVKGMTCNHCKNSVETHLKQLNGVDTVSVNLDNKYVIIAGKNLDLEKIANEINSLGFEYNGEVNNSLK